MALKNLLQPLTTDNILARFHKVIDDLATVRKNQLELADRKEEEASQKISEANAARREANRADDAIGRLENVFGSAA